MSSNHEHVVPAGGTGVDQSLLDAKVLVVLGPEGVTTYDGRAVAADVLKRNPRIRETARQVVRSSDVRWALGDLDEEGEANA